MRIAMIGTGYVGLVSGTCFSEFGIPVTCVDKDARKIQLLGENVMPIFEPGLDEMVATNVESGRLSFTTELAPAVKAAGGITWFVNGNTPNATANEVYNDIVALVTQVINQASGNIDQKSKFVLALSPKSSLALNFTNLYNVNVTDMLTKNFPNLRVETAVQYGALSAQNPQGIAGGELVQLICEEVLGQKTAFCAFNEKLRAFPIFRHLSSYKQKMMQGTWGAVIRQPFAISQLIGV